MHELGLPGGRPIRKSDGHRTAYSGALVLLVAILALASFFLTPVALSQTLVTTVAVGSTPYGVAYDSGKGELFVTNAGSNSVSVISDATNTVVATITVGAYPYGAAYDSARGEVFVTNGAAGTVSVISDATNTVVATITVGTNPFGVAYDSGKAEIFVSNQGSNTVTVISDATNAVVTSIPVGTHPFGVAYDSALAELFVANEGGASVSVVSDSTNTVVATVSVGTNPIGVSYDSTKGEVFVTNEASNTVSVISDATNTVVATITVGTNPFGVAYDSGKAEIFVVDVGSNTVSVISDATNTIVRTLTVGTHPYAAAYDSSAGETFVTNAASGSVSVISDRSASSTTVNCLPSSIPSGSSSICTATVVGLSPTGTVTLTQSGTGTISFPSSSSCTLASGTCSVTVNGANAGGVTITGTYSGDSINLGSSGTFGLVVTVSTTSTTSSTTSTSSTTTTSPTTTSSTTASTTSTVSTTATITVTVSVTSSTTVSTATTTTTVAASSSTTTVTSTSVFTSTTTLSTGACTTCLATSLTVSCASASVAVGTMDSCYVTVQSFGSIPTGFVNWADSPSGSGTFSSNACQLSFFQVYYFYYSTCAITYRPNLPPGSSIILTATYGGDSLNSPSIGSSSLSVAPKPTVTTAICTPRTSVTNIQTPIVCTATVTGYGVPTGTMTWSQSGTGSVLFVHTSCTLASGSCSVNMTDLTAGPLKLKAVYGGDPNNKASTRITTLSLLKAPTSVVIGCTPSSLSAGSLIVCSGSVFGNYPTHTGTISWVKVSGHAKVLVSPKICQPSAGACSTTVVITSPGSFSLRATYSGDRNNVKSWLTLQYKASPTVVPSLSISAVAVSTPVIDSATLKGGYIPGGTITYNYFLGNTCTGVPTVVGIPLDVVGGVPLDSPPQYFVTAGSYSWNAVYSGDANNNGATSPCQFLAVNPGTDALYVSLSSSSIIFGSSITASGSLVGTIGSAGGIVTYQYFSGSYCSGPATAVGAPLPVTNGLVPTSSPQVFNTPGSFSLNSVYSGDPSNNPTTSPCQPLEVKGAPTLVVTLSSSSISVGGSVSASSTLTGITSSAGGKVLYEFFSLPSCTGSATTVGAAVTVTNGFVPNSASWQFAASGSYSWNAIYSGDGDNIGVTSACVPLTVTPAITTTTTTTVSTTLTSTVSTTTTATTSFIAMLPYSFLPAALAIMILAGLPNPILGRVGPRLSRRKMH